MELIVGGAYQGKLEYILNKNNFTKHDVAFNEKDIYSKKVVYGLHLFIKQWLKSEKNVKDEIDKIITHNPNIIFICDEVGYGIVPIDKFDRQFREEVGRSCCYIAKIADKVIRIVCGMEIIIK